jgi:hypothetical protein
MFWMTVRGIRAEALQGNPGDDLSLAVQFGDAPAFVRRNLISRL